MKPIDIAAQGLDLRTPDRLAAPGVCRVLHNLFPTGSQERPIWRPVNTAEMILEPHATGKIVAFHVWHRANKDSAIVYLFQSTESGNVETRAKSGIFLRLVDTDGNIRPGVSTLFEFPPDTQTLVDLERSGQFAQMGDNLILSVKKAGEAGDLYVVTIFNGVEFCFPFNIPFEPYGFAVDATQVSALDTTATKSSLAGGFGLRAAFELFDGTYVRPSGVLYLGYLPVVTEEGVGHKIVITMPKLEIDTERPWSKLIRGVAIFMSDVRGDTQAILSSSLWRYVGTMTKVFTQEDSLTIDLYQDDVPLKEALTEDVLSNHDVRADGVFSYNKLLLAHGIRYSYRRPIRTDLSRTTTTDGDTGGGQVSVAHPVDNLRQVAAAWNPRLEWRGTYNEMKSWAISAQIAWNNPTLAQTVAAIKEIEVQRRYQFGHILLIPEDPIDPRTGIGMVSAPADETIVQDPEWITVQRGIQEGLTNPFTIKFIVLANHALTNLLLTYRVRVTLVDGKVSPWREITINGSPD